MFLGIILTIIEITYEILKIRPKSLLAVNCTIGVLLMTLYFISTKSSIVFRNIKQIFIVFYLIYFSSISRNIIISPTDNIPIVAYVVAFFFSYSVLKPAKLYWGFVVAVFTYFGIIFIFDLVPLKTILVLFINALIILIINYIHYILWLNSNDEFRFNNQIINKGNSLILATNKKGEIVFCSETITPILGYSKEEVMGLGYWKHTEDSRIHWRKLSFKFY